MSTIVTIADIVLDGNNGVTRIDDSGGWNAPEQRTERGFEYSSYVDREPIEATIEARVEPETRRDLERLRSRDEPFAASIDHISMRRAKLSALDSELAGGDSHYLVTLTVKEIRESELDSVELTISSDAGDQSSAAASSEPSFAQPEEDETGTSEETTSNGVAGTLSSVREGLSGVLS